MWYFAVYARLETKNCLTFVGWIDSIPFLRNCQHKQADCVIGAVTCQDNSRHIYIYISSAVDTVVFSRTWQQKLVVLQELISVTSSNTIKLLYIPT